MEYQNSGPSGTLSSLSTKVDSLTQLELGTLCIFATTCFSERTVLKRYTRESKVMRTAKTRAWESYRPVTPFYTEYIPVAWICKFHEYRSRYSNKKVQV